MSNELSTLRDAIADLIDDYVADPDGPVMWVADAILALPEMQAREAVIAAAREFDLSHTPINRLALSVAVADLDALA